MEGNELGLHHAMARLSAKLDGLGVFISAITSESAGRNKYERETKNHDGRVALSWIVQINFRIRRDLGSRRSPSSSSLKPHARHDHEQTKYQKRRQDDVGDDTEIRVIGCLRQLDKKQQQDAHDRGDYDHGAGEAYV